MPKYALEVKRVGVMSHPDGDLVDVEVEITDGEKSHVRKFGFPIGTDEKTIAAELRKVAEGLNSDAAHQEAIAEHEAQLKQVDEARAALEGKTF